MQGKIKATAILQNPDGAWDDEIPVQFEPGEERRVLAQVGGSLGNGLMRWLGPKHLEVIPACRIKSLEVQFSDVAVASPADLETAKKIADVTSKLGRHLK